MRRIQIALVGGQPSPVYNIAKEYSFDELILVHSNDTLQQAERLRNMLSKVGTATIRLVCLDAVDLDKISESIKEIAEGIKDDDELIVNLSGGTKPWSLLFFEAFKDYPFSECIYIDQNNIIWNLKQKNSKALEYRCSLDELLLLNGVVINSKRLLRDYTEEDFECFEDIRKLRRLNIKAFSVLTQDLSDHSDKTTAETQDGCQIKWDPYDKAFSCHFEDRWGHELNVKLQSPHVRQLLLNSGWFELEVASLLARWTLAENVWLNCELKREDSDKNLNEIDIIVDTGDKFLFVECKVSVFSPTDIDKFNNAVKQYGGLGSKRIFITERELTGQAEVKCKQANIPYFSFLEITRSQKDKELFFKRLTKYLEGINDK